ncbi:MAG TPA: hypothetical protein VE604_15920 [Candidatus Polarisedimenticolia bacterium]|jgi:hypothetical protein|nr:hypothetical protein [Candidatus Polarisedimenticolia bacterium]
MVFGMSLATFTLIHVIISLVGIGSGLIVLFGMFSGKRLDGMTALFLATTALTSVTGFGFPFEHITPGIILGILSLVVLAIAVAARYSFHMAGRWRAIYVITAVIALYFNCFVLIAQSFQKILALHALAPKGNEPPFAIAQGILLVLFIVAGILAVKKFHPAAAMNVAHAASNMNL